MYVNTNCMNIYIYQGCDWKLKGPEEKLGRGAGGRSGPSWGPGGEAPESSWILAF
jgi:hypothetical protein